MDGRTELRQLIPCYHSCGRGKKLTYSAWLVVYSGVAIIDLVIIGINAEEYSSAELCLPRVDKHVKLRVIPVQLYNISPRSGIKVIYLSVSLHCGHYDEIFSARCIR